MDLNQSGDFSISFNSEFLNTLAEAVIIFNQHGDILHFNANALEILGKARDHDFLGRIVNKVIQTGVAQRDQINRLDLVEGSFKWISISAVPIISNGQIVLTFNDITEVKKLQHDQKYLNATLDTLPALVSYVDQNLIYRYVNQTYERWFKVTREMTIGKSVPEILGVEAFTLLKPQLNAVLKGELQKFERKIPYENAGERIVEVTYTPDIHSGEVKGFYAVIIDVTELALSKTAVQLKEQELSRVLNAVPALIGHWDLNLNNLHANTAYSEYFGKSPEEIKGRHIKKLLGQELYEKNRPYMEGALKGEVQIFEREMPLPHGGSKHTIAQYLPEIVNGDVIGFFVIVSDVTPLKMSEAKFKGFLETSYDAIVLVSEKSIIQFVNQQVLNWFGYTSAELVGQPIEILIPERYRESHVKMRNDYALHPTARGMGRNLDLWGRRKDGTEFSVEISLAPLQTDQGLIISATIRDITEKKLIETQQKFALNANLILSQTMDYDERLQTITDLSVPTLADWCAVSIFENSKLRLKAISKKREAVPEEMKLEKTDKYFSSKFIRVPLLVRSNVIGTLAFAMEESGRVFLPQDFNYAETLAMRFALSADSARLYKEAQDAIRAREDVVAIVSHDLKNPLGAIALSVQILEKKTPDGIGNDEWEKMKKSIDRIKNSTQKAITLVKDLLDISKIESGTFVVERKDIDINSLISNVIEIMKPLAEEKGVQIIVNFQYKNLSIACDPDRIMQVFSNLIGNALKFTERGGKIQVNATVEDDTAHFSVEDSGQGISKENLPHIFDRYWQARETRKLGSGLGLAIAKGIVDAHQGRIWVESELGKGSTFHFTLP